MEDLTTGEKKPVVPSTRRVVITSFLVYALGTIIVWARRAAECRTILNAKFLKKYEIGPRVLAARVGKCSSNKS